MSVHKRVSAVLCVLAATLLSVFLGPAAAHAAPYTDEPDCAISTSDPAVGADVTVSGTGFGAHVVVHIALHSQTYNLGDATTNGSGAFSTSVGLPGGVSGNHTITVTGPTSGSVGCGLMNIGEADNGGTGTGGTGTGANSGGGTLASTGAAVLGIGTLGLVLLAGGGLMLYSGRRRKVAA